MNGKRVIGVDIGKSWLDVGMEGCERVQRYGNNAAGIAALIEQLDPVQDVVVFERTGGWERNLEAALADKMITWAVVHSQPVKAFRQVQGIKAKTDRIDARLLRDYGRDRLNAGKLRSGHREDVTLDALMARQRQLKAMLHAENCRLATTALVEVRSSIENLTAHLKEALAAIAVELAQHEGEHAELAFKEGILCGQIGVARTDRTRPSSRAARARQARLQGDYCARRIGSARSREREHSQAPRAGAWAHINQGHPVQPCTYGDAVRPADQGVL